jgi:hypothetical protein
MIESFMIGLTSLVVALWIQRAFLVNRTAKLRATEQAFQFHAFRDDLQLYVAEGRIDPSSPTYDFLMQMVNFSIRNAGALKLREMLAITEKVKSKVDKNSFKKVAEDIHKQDIQVQELVQRFFFAMANMLISNDWIVRCGVRTASTIAVGVKTLTPAVKVVHYTVTAILRIVTPTKVKAVREARWYLDQGNRLKVPC